MANADRVRLLGLIRHDAIENFPPERWPFTEAPRDVRSLTRDATYAIPVALLERIDSDLPGWLSPTELAQERHFAELCAGRTSVGVFLGEFVGHDFLLHDPMPSSTELYRMLDGETHFANRAQLENSVRCANERLQPLNERLEAYVGWLVTDSQFRQELTALRQKWETDLARLGRIPQIPVEQELERWRQTSGLDQPDHELAREFAALYERWQLRGLASWDLPIPQGANLGLPANCSHLFFTANRPAIALAATLRLPGDDSPVELLETDAPAQLREWRLIQDQQHPNNMSYGRLAIAFKVYFLDTLVLRRAYPEKLQGNIATIDWLLGQHLEAGAEDSIKKLRQWNNRRCAATPDRPGRRPPR